MHRGAAGTKRSSAPNRPGPDGGGGAVDSGGTVPASLTRAVGTLTLFWMNLQTRYELNRQLEIQDAELDSTISLVARSSA